MLTEEQRDIVELLKQGKTNKYIAKKLFMSKSTYYRKLNNLCEILGANEVTLIMKLEQEGMI